MTRKLTLCAMVLALGTASVASAQFPQPFRKSFQFPQQQPQQFPQQQTQPFPQQQPFPQPELPPQFPPPIAENHFHVLYRACSHDRWVEFGSYDCDRTAHRIEHLIELRGYQAKVVPH